MIAFGEGRLSCGFSDASILRFVRNEPRALNIHQRTTPGLNGWTLEQVKLWLRRAWDKRVELLGPWLVPR